jgi:hypothetical protein
MTHPKRYNSEFKREAIQTDEFSYQCRKLALRFTVFERFRLVNIFCIRHILTVRLRVGVTR